MKKYKLKKVGAISIGKVNGLISGILYAIAGLILGPIYLGVIFSMMGSNGMAGALLGLVVGPALGFVGGFVIGFIYGIVVAWLYNIAAKYVGPIEIELA